MHIVVLTKPVPDPAAAAERLGPDGRLDRAVAPAVVNGNDEYALEAALKLIEVAGGEVTLLAMAPPNGTDTMRKALAMGATRGVLVTDPALGGACVRSTTQVLAAALRALTFDLVFAGADSSDGGGGVVPAGIATLLHLPYLGNAARIEPDAEAGRVRVRRITPAGYELLDAPMPAMVVCTQVLGEPRYPSLKGIMGARSKEIVSRSLADVGLAGDSVGGGAASTVVLDSRRPPARGATRVVRGSAAEGAHEIVAFLEIPAADLMSTIWVIAETALDGSLVRSATETATLGRTLAASSGLDLAGVVVAVEPTGAAAELAQYLPRVLAIADPEAAGHAWAVIAAERVAALIDADPAAVVLLSAGPDGRDVAGTLSALTTLGVLVNAIGVSWDGGPRVEMNTFGGKLVTTSGFSGPGGIITVRPNSVTAEPSAKSGTVESVAARAGGSLPRVAIVERVTEAGAAAPIEEARIIVSGGRGVGGTEGFDLVREIAAVLGGAVGASRAAVDAGWIPYAQQIGQTGKFVKPQLYLALGISGAIQHKVGMQTAETIVAVNRDPDAPIAEFADLLVVGDLFEVAPALLVALRARPG